jgi:hypothetical protein
MLRKSLVKANLRFFSGELESQSDLGQAKVDKFQFEIVSIWTEIITGLREKSQVGVQ